MNFEETARTAAVRGLLAHGLTENMAERITGRMIGFQPDEWKRILDRASAGQVKALYVVVTHYDSNNFGTLLYAPADLNNIATLITWLGSKMGAGCLGNSPVDEDEPDQEIGSYSVSVFDIGNEMNRALRAISPDG